MFNDYIWTHARTVLFQNEADGPRCYVRIPHADVSELPALYEFFPSEEPDWFVAPTARLPLGYARLMFYVDKSADGGADGVTLKGMVQCGDPDGELRERAQQYDGKSLKEVMELWVEEGPGTEAARLLGAAVA